MRFPDGPERERAAPSERSRIAQESFAGYWGPPKVEKVQPARQGSRILGVSDG